MVCVNEQPLKSNYQITQRPLLNNRVFGYHIVQSLMFAMRYALRNLSAVGSTILHQSATPKKQITPYRGVLVMMTL